MPAVPLAAGAFIAGTAAAAILGGPWWATGLVAAAVAAAAWVWRPPRGGLLAPALVLAGAVAFAAAGHARFAEFDARDAPALATVEGTHDVIGVARADAFVRGSTARVDLSLEEIDGEPVAGGLRLTLPAPAESVRAGDRIAAVLSIERPSEVATFDYARYLRDRGIHAVAAFPLEWSVIERDTGNPVRRALRNLRRRLVQNLGRSLPEPHAALTVGMLIGERRTIPADLTDDLRATGTSHLVVVSGQNVAMLLATAVALLTVVMSRRRAALLTLTLLPGYLLLVGLDPPVVRAAIMAVGIAVAAVAGRRTPGWIYLLYAATLMLAVDPLLARDVAFQLSTSATVGVMLLTPPLRDRALSIAGWDAGGRRAALVEAAATATGAAVAVLPVQAAAFERVSILTVPANVLVAPLYEATLVVGLAGAVLGWLDPLADALSIVGSPAPGAFIGIVEALADLPAGEITVRAPLAAGAAWYLGVIALIWVFQGREPPVLASRARSGLATTTSLAVVAGGLWLAVLTPPADLASVTVLDVGQGLAVLVRDGGASVLVDAGPPDGAAVRALSRADAGRALDAIVITHLNTDHTGGLSEIERRFEVGRLLGGAATGGEPIDIGDRIRLSDRTTIEVISPPVATAGREHASENNHSLVLLVTIGERRMLLTADIETEAERWLIASGIDLRADVLVVPHHGSKSSSTREFLDAVRPRVAVISAGAGNRHGHPHAEVVERYVADGVLLFRTDEAGDVTLRSDGRRIWARTSR